MRNQSGRVGRTLGVVLLAVVASLGGAGVRAEEPGWDVYVGTYTKPGGSQGIYRLRLDGATGELGAPKLVAQTPSPSFLAMHPTEPWLYAVNELTEYQGEPAGSVSAYAIRGDGLMARNVVSSKGGAPCHLVVDPSGRYVVVANYVGGNVSVLPIQEDGSLGEAVCVVDHEGQSVNKQRQEGPHAHGVYFDPAGKVLAAPDLGIDQVRLSRLDPATGMLSANEPAFAAVEAGSGPRHMAYCPDGAHAYVINEMASTVTAFRADRATGGMTAVQTISTLPEGFSGNSSTAEVFVHPSGKFLYGSNRGHDSLAIFAIDTETGRLTALGHQPTGGKTPRGFGIDPTGTWLVAGNQDSDSVVVFRINPENGGLTQVGEPVKVGMPVSILFVPREG